MTFKRVNIEHILLFPSTPYVEDAPYQLPLERMMADMDLWWNSKGVDLQLQPAQVIRGHSINVYQENPWYDTLNWLHNEDRFIPGNLYVVFLYGWYSAAASGWGARPLALVGNYVMQTLASIGNPDSIVDDKLGAFITMHEQGHAFGLNHDFNERGSVMGYDTNSGLNAIMGAQSWDAIRAQPLRLSTAVDLREDHGEPQPCTIELIH